MIRELPSGSIVIEDNELFVLDSRGHKRELEDFISFEFDMEIDNLADELRDIFRFCDVKMSDYGEMGPGFIKKMVDKKNENARSNIIHLIRKMERAKSLSELNGAYNELISMIKGSQRFVVDDKDEVHDYLDSYTRGLHTTASNVVLTPGGRVDDYLLPSGQSVRDFRICFAENGSSQKKMIIDYVQTLHSFLQEKILFEQRVDRVKKSGVSERKVTTNIPEIGNGEPSMAEAADSTYESENDGPVITEHIDSIFESEKEDSVSDEYEIFDLTEVPLKKFDKYPDRELAYKIIIDENTLYAKEAALDELMDKIDIRVRFFNFIKKLPDGTFIRHIEENIFDDVPLIESILTLDVPITCSPDVKGASSVSEEMAFFGEKINILRRRADFLKSEIDFLRSKIDINCKMISSLIGSEELDNLLGKQTGIHR